MAAQKPERPSLLQTPLRDVRSALRGDGLWLDVGLVTSRVQAAVGNPEHVQLAYRHFPFEPAGTWADLHIRLNAPRSIRRWVKPQVQFFCDNSAPFEPFPSDTALPMLEWGGNWLIGRRMNHVLLLHAGVLERNGLVLVLPAMPGSGKSTLTAALSLRGWRLLSDEFGAYDVNLDAFLAVLKPVALKNRSIDVIRQFEPAAEIGPEFPRTRKGTVAHLSPAIEAVGARHTPARPGAIILPKWDPTSATRCERLRADTAFSSIAFNAFNYTVLGAEGFRAVAHLSDRCPAWQVIYSDLDEVVEAIDRLWPEVVEHQIAGLVA
jgi:HprK-related kinase A